MKNKSLKKGWWSFSFLMEHNEFETDLTIDLMLAHTVANPTLYPEYKKHLNLWRFHRRSVDDHRGHDFMFEVFCPMKVAEEMFNKFEDNSLLKELLKAGTIMATDHTPFKKNHRPRIQDISDKKWPLPIRRSWPFFAMGLSCTWLEMINQAMHGVAYLSPIDIESALLEYAEAEEEITELWQRSAQHVFFHHTSAMFGYEEMWLQKAIKF